MKNLDLKKVPETDEEIAILEQVIRSKLQYCHWYYKASEPVKNELVGVTYLKEGDYKVEWILDISEFDLVKDSITQDRVNAKIRATVDVDNDRVCFQTDEKLSSLGISLVTSDITVYWV